MEYFLLNKGISTTGYPKVKIKVLTRLLLCMAINAQALELKVCDPAKQIAICDKDISNMDDTLSFLYQYVHTFSNDKQFVSKNSEDFKTALAACNDKECVADMFGSQIGYMFDNLDESITLYGADDMKGLWYANDVTSFSNYGSVILTDQFIYWGVTDASGNALLASNNKKVCRAKYSIVEEPMGTVFVDQLDRRYEIKEDKDFDTALIKVESSTCEDADFEIGAFRLTVNYRNMRALNLIEYNKMGMPAKLMTFTR